MGPKLSKYRVLVRVQKGFILVLAYLWGLWGGVTPLGRDI